jgi:pullulanase
MLEKRMDSSAFVRQSAWLNRLALTLLLLGSLLAGFACDRSPAPNVAPSDPVKSAQNAPKRTESEFPRLATLFTPADFNAKAIAIVHYHRPDQRYDHWNLWAWREGGEGKSHPFTGTTPFGRYAVIPLPEVPPAGTRIGFIVRKGNWELKDIPEDRFVTFDGNSVAETWLVSGEPRVHSDPMSIDLTVRVKAAFLDAPNRITLATSGALSSEQIQSLKLHDRDEPQRAVHVKSVTPVPDDKVVGMVYSVELTESVRLPDLTDLQVQIGDLPARTVYARDILNGEEFTPLDAQLGYRFLSPASITFTTWSPVAEKVELVLYGSGDAANPRVLPLTAGAKGLWSVTVPEDLHLSRYRYRFHSYGKVREVPDIHTAAATYDSAFSVVLDLDRLQPDFWTAVPQPKLKQPTDEVLYEVHVRDYTIADTTVPANLRGTYLGLIHENPAARGKVSSGINHLTDLGVTAVHLLPIHDFTAKVGEYNWGYWTALFNVPESNYSTNPSDPTRAVYELRQTIQGLHKAGIRVILDVVYNHTSSSGEYSPFDQTVPYYYFRTTTDGKLRNDAGVGNSMADERPMVRKYIVDSVKFWLNEYRVDGFRFDLLGTHHPETARAVVDAAVAIRPDVTLYGEPWTGGGPTYFGKGQQRGSRMAVFNDHLRNAIRGDLDGTTTGFATGPGGDLAAIKKGIMGSIDDFADQPIETINYASAHDNLTFWDKLLKAQPNLTEKQHRAMQKLATGVVLTSQGIPFIHGGCDFARTKGGNHNSYNASDEVNKFDWARKAEYADVHNYTRGLIAIRRAHPAFRLTTAEQVRKHLKFVDSKVCIKFTLDGTAIGDSWGTILVAYNGEAEGKTITLPEGQWKIVADDKKAGTETLWTVSSTLTLPGWSLIIAWR